MTIGNKLAVFRGKADRTAGGLTKKDLMVNKRGKVVSRKAHEAGKRAFKRNGLQAKNAEEMAAIRR